MSIALQWELKTSKVYMLEAESSRKYVLMFNFVYTISETLTSGKIRNYF